MRSHCTLASPGKGACIAARLACLAAALLCLLPSRAPADALDDIQARGTLVVGVKQDVPPWGMPDPQRRGHVIGLEPDLAADLARRLGVKLRLVVLLTSERLQALESGRVDVLIAFLADTPERRRQMTLVLPHYFASGVSVLARRTFGFRRWEDLRQRRVCGRQGAFYNRALTVGYGMDIVALYSNGVALPALRDGRCDALLYDDTAIAIMLKEPRWSGDFEMALPPLYVAPWSIALHRAEAGGRLEARVSQALVDWHRSGLLLALERRWGIPPTAHSARMHALWSRRTQEGWYCGESVTAQTPPECL